MDIGGGVLVKPIEGGPMLVVETGQDPYDCEGTDSSSISDALS